MIYSLSKTVNEHASLSLQTRIEIEYCFRVGVHIFENALFHVLNEV